MLLFRLASGWNPIGIRLEPSGFRQTLFNTELGFCAYFALSQSAEKKEESKNSKAAE